MIPGWQIKEKQKNRTAEKMIESSADNIHILYPDGSSAVFDSSELRLRLARSLAEANQDDLSAAEDIALAVEFSLRSAFREAGICNIPAAELDRAVAKSLEDAGFSLVSEKFLSVSAASSAVSKLTLPELAFFLRRSLSLDEAEAETLGEKVKEALKKLGLEKCSRRLAVELAKELRDIAAEEQLKKRQNLIQRSKKIFLPCPGEITGRLGEEYRSLFESGAVKLNSSTALFPSVRVEIFLEKVLEQLAGGTGEEELPITELVLAPVLARCAACVDAIYEAMGKEICTGGKLPLVITFSEMNLFVEKYLLAGNGEGSPEKCSRSLGAYFKGMLKTSPFRIRYGK